VGRTKWTDERLDDSFDRLDRDVRELRGEMRDGFAELRLLIYRMGGGLFVTMLATIFLRGI
jgi:hypothetical protein